MWLDVPPLWLENSGTIPAGFFVLRFAEKPPLHQEPQGLHGVIVVDAVLRFHGHHSFTQIKTQGRAQPNTAVPVCSILNSDFSLIPVFASLPLAGSVQHGQRLACPHGDFNPPRFSPGRPHCVILWLDGSARCPLPLTAQAGAARQLGDVPRWLLVRGCRMRTLTCSVFKERRESERSAAHSFSANYAALFRGRLIYPFIFIGIEKGFFIEPF